MDEKAHERSGWSWWYLLFIVQFVAVLWPPFYNKVEPAGSASRSSIGTSCSGSSSAPCSPRSSISPPKTSIRVLRRRRIIDQRADETQKPGETCRAGSELDCADHLRALFGFITWLGFAAAHWRKGDLDLLHEWGLGGRRFGTVVTWFLVGGDLYTAYTFIAVPALAFGAGAIAFFAVPYTIVIYPILFLVFPRLWHVCHKHGYITAGRFRARPLRQSLAGAGGDDHRHRRHHALYRAAAGRHPGGDRRAGRLGGTGLMRRPAADHRLRDPGGLHLFERPAGAGLDRHRQGHPDLHHRFRRHHRHADPARRLRQDLRGGAAGEAAAGGARRQHHRRLRHLCDAGARLGAGAVPLSAFA